METQAAETVAAQHAQLKVDGYALEVAPPQQTFALKLVEMAGSLTQQGIQPYVTMVPRFQATVAAPVAKLRMAGLVIPREHPQILMPTATKTGEMDLTLASTTVISVLPTQLLLLSVFSTPTLEWQQFLLDSSAQEVLRANLTLAEKFVEMEDFSTLLLTPQLLAVGTNAMMATSLIMTDAQHHAKSKLHSSPAIHQPTKIPTTGLLLSSQIAMKNATTKTTEDFHAMVIALNSAPGVAAAAQLTLDLSATDQPLILTLVSAEKSVEMALILQPNLVTLNPVMMET